MVASPDPDLTLTRFADLTAEQSEYVWRMRSHPEVSRWMSNPDPIPWDAHRAFMARQADDRSNLNLLAEDVSGPMGVISLHNLSSDERKADLGIYRNPFRTERGLGRRLLSALHAVGFGELGLDRIELEVRSDNAAARRLYLSEGYEQTAEDQGFVTMVRFRDQTDTI